MNSRMENKRGVYFVNGSGGTEKTYLWKTIITKLRSDDIIILSVSSSRITSLLLPGGRTAIHTLKLSYKYVKHHVVPLIRNQIWPNLFKKYLLLYGMKLQ